MILHRACFRHLLLVLLVTERTWAHAMELKDDMQMAQDDGKPTERLALHMRKRLKTAVRSGARLLELAKTHANERTMIEAEAYVATLRAALATACDKWPDALAQYSRAK
jgi:hypothetical protein